MFNGGRSVRAFRPSQVARTEDLFDEEDELTKQEKIRQYIQKAQAGLPLFEEETSDESVSLNVRP